MPEASKQYFAERHGRGPLAQPIPFEQLRRLVVSVLDDLRARGYMQETFGFECVDGDSLGTLGHDPDAYFLRTIGRENIWPYWKSGEHFDANCTSWDEDTLFDVIEVMHDLVAKPLKGRYHDYAECGMHYSTFDRTEGQKKYRAEIDNVLRLSDPAYRMNDLGLVVELAAFSAG